MAATGEKSVFHPGLSGSNIRELEADSAPVKSRSVQLHRTLCFLVGALVSFGLSRSLFSGFGRSHLVQSSHSSARVTREAPCYGSVLNWTATTPSDDVGYRYHSNVSTLLPIDFERLLFLSQSARASGALVITQTAPRGGTDAEVDVDVHYNYPEALVNLTLCRLHRKESYGIGISTKDDQLRLPGKDLSMRFNIHVRLPAVHSADVNKRQLGNLYTQLPHFEQRMHNLSQYVFDYAWLQGNSAPIHADFIDSPEVWVSNSNAPISGVFSTSHTLGLENENAPIVSHINLVDGTPSSPDAPNLRVTLRTSNSSINSSFALHADTAVTNGTFFISAQTDNAPIDVRFTDAPPDSLLKLEARTAYAPVYVALHDTYEGAFMLSSSLHTPSVRWRQNPEDPAGRGRFRHVSYATRGGRLGQRSVDGHAFWLPGRSTNGRVQVETTYGLVGLDVGQVD